MALGLLYDVHGNLAALDAVLEDAHHMGVTRFLLGGDYSSFGAWPADVVDRMEQLEDAVWLRGNWDRWQTGDTHDMPAEPALRAGLEAVVEALGPERVERLGALPERIEQDGTLFCHGAPRTDMDSFLPDPREEDGALLEGESARRVVFGHTHLAFHRWHEGVELLNPGSVGMPFDGDQRAAWAILHPDGRVEQRRVAYDVEGAVAALRNRFGPGDWVEGSIARLHTARFSV